MHCFVCNGINCIIAYCQTKKRQQNFDQPNLPVAQQTLTLLLLLLLDFAIVIVIYSCILLLSLSSLFCYFISLLFLFQKEKSKTAVHFTERPSYVE